MKPLDAIVFEDPTQAEQRILTIMGRAQSSLRDALVQGLKETSDPDTVLVRIERFLEASEENRDSDTNGAEAERARMTASPRYVRLMCRVFDQSHFLTDIVYRDPGLMRWLADEALLDRAWPREEMVGALCAQVENAQNDFNTCARIMRLFRQREILRIATREVFAYASLASLTEDISNLADAAMEAALHFAWTGLVARFGTPMSTPEPDEAAKPKPVTFVVIGMGKLGGRELNFSSDIDLIFLYSDEGETTGVKGHSISTGEFFQKLGEQVIRLVSDITPEGMIFRVDMRLRPYGRSSPLAVTVDRAIEYYSQYAQAWERQALIKARPAAGDHTIGDIFIERTRPTVFPRYFDDETLDSIRTMKGQMEARIEERGETELDVKLGRGGIRDVEFTVQMLQMLNGGKMPEFRTNNTLTAIRALGMRGLLSPFEAHTLASNYTFMRRVEHRLQIEGGQQRHVLPTHPLDLERLSIRLGYEGTQPFLDSYQERATATRNILDRFLATEGSGKLWTYDLLSMHTDGLIGMERLTHYGFKDVQRARDELRILSAGSNRRPHPFHIRQLFARIVPTLLEALSTTGDPDDTLIRLSRIVINLQAPSALYGILNENPALTRELVVLVANSQFLSEILVRDPGLFDLLANPNELRFPTLRTELIEMLDGLLHAYDSNAAPYRLHQEGTLRVGLRELFRGASIIDVGHELSDLAEVCLQHALDVAHEIVARRYAEASGAFAVLALGKLGGRELGYGSDLDLVFVYDADAAVDSEVMAPSEYFAAVAAQVIRHLKEPSRYGVLYDIDARLRPDGNRGVLAVNHLRIRDYYLNDAQPWERLALTKVRAVAGDMAFGLHVADGLRDIAFATPLTPDDVSQIEAIRVKIARGADALDLKKREGGIAEIEFVTRLRQIRQVCQLPAEETAALKGSNVLDALDALESVHGIKTDEAQTLREAYLLFRRIENRIRMMTGRPGVKIPKEPEAQTVLARHLGIDQNLTEAVTNAQARVHSIYLDTIVEMGVI